MPTDLQTRPSPRLALYGIVFRVLRGVALRPNGRPRKSVPEQPRRRPRTASLEVEGAQGGQLHRPAVES